MRDGSQQHKRHHTPERTCLGCRTTRTQREVLRLVRTPQGQVVLDQSGRAPGRGVYVCYDVTCLQKALQPAKLTSALKHPVTVPTVEVVYQAVVRLLYERLGACLSMAQRAGALVSGYVALRRACAQARVLCLVCAEDIAAVRLVEYRAWCTPRGIPCITLFTKEELGRRIGKASRSAVGLTTPHFCELLGAMLASLERLFASRGDREAQVRLSH
jgi:predicted RNA-binding protein YlxR (DUF448 family)